MKKFRVTVNGNTYEVEVEELGGNGGFVSTPSTVAPVAVAPQAASAPAAAPVASAAKKIVAPMPGKIIDVKVSVGQQVNKGDVLAILEAMKMENEVVASEAGTVAGIHANKGQSVESGDVIVSMN